MLTENEPANEESPATTQVLANDGTVSGDHGQPPLQEEQFRPFTTIWIRPRQTVREIIARDPGLHVALLASLTGIGEALDRASNRSLGDNAPLAVILIVSLVVGPIGGLISLWFGSVLLSWTGGWLGARGRRDEVKTAMAWASVPVVCAYLLWVPLLLLIGAEMFKTETPRLDAQLLLAIPVLGTIGAQAVLGIWSLVLLCNTIAEVQRFSSAWRGFANVLLAGAVVVVPLLIVGILLTQI